MNSNQKIARIVGVLLLLVFVIGIYIYQFLRGPIVFSENYLTEIASNSNQIISSIILGFTSGLLSITVALIALPLFKRHSFKLAYGYLVFCIVNFVAISFENFGVVALMELSEIFVKNGAVQDDFFEHTGALLYEIHTWTHYVYLLISCLPVFVFYYILWYSKLIPRVVSGFGVFAVLLMFVEMLCSIYGIRIEIPLMIPLALVQLFLPLWLIFKGFNETEQVGLRK